MLVCSPTNTMPAAPSQRLAGEWSLPNLAGGCPKHNSWAQNPQFRLVPKGGPEQTCEITVTCALKLQIGFIVLRTTPTDIGGRKAGPGKLVAKELAFKTGVSQVVMLPFEAGVIEFGNTRAMPQWGAIPDAPYMPKAPLRKAFESLSALYVVYWKADRATNKLRVIADYENPRETALRRVLRSDDESFVKISRRLELDVDSAEIGRAHV